ncbi:MAG: type III-A CRISPR-associated protein Cas10/Csm1 [Thermodesulfobacteriota bacterium]
MEDKFMSLVKGALLHDIGKVVQRANDNPTVKKHSEWGYEWLKDNLKDDLAAMAAIAHHYTKDDDYALNNNFGLIWYQADNLASKERKGREKLQEGEWHSEITLASPFSRVNNPDNPEESPTLAYLPLFLEKIDRTTATESPCSKQDYKRLFDAFETDFNSHEIQKPPSLNFLLMLFEKHFSHVPSITMKIYDGLKKEEIKEKHPDISLFDHLKLTAAIAGCMYRYYSETYPEKWNKNELLRDEILNISDAEKPYLLIGGDISGVQKFIYTITSKGALKSLKGRSFYLELFTEHIVSKLITALSLTRCNLIFLGGGHFYILSHNTPKAQEAIKEIKKGIDEYLFKEFSGRLQLHMEAEPFHQKLFKNSSEVWGKLAEILQKAKKTKWKGKLQDILKPQMPHKECLTQYCEVCFREDIPLKPLERGVNRVYDAICDSCKCQYELGEELKRISEKEHPVLYRFDLEKSEKDPETLTIKIESSKYLLQGGWDKEIHQDASAVYRINDFTAKHYSHPNSIYMPIGFYQHKDLEELSDASPVFGLNRIAVLRMDVDNLGKVFSTAIPEEHKTFSRMASISRELNKFFKQYLNTIVEGKNVEEPTDLANRDVKSKGRMLTIVYSGGDDLFLIGHWLDVTEVAFDISNYFRKFTGNSFITISGGIALNHEKYPVYQYAREAEEAEALAKKNKNTPEDKTKNSISIFGNKPFKWVEAEKIVERVRLFTKFLKPAERHLAVDEKRLPSTFFYRLLSLSRQFNEKGVLILPKAAYLISRAKFGENGAEDSLKIKEVIMTQNVNQWKINETATMWTLMLTKKGGGEDAGE